MCPYLAKMYGSVYSKIAMPDRKFTVLDLLDLDLKAHNSLDLNCLCGRKGLVRAITVPDLNRPGLALTGFYDSFAYDRVQLFGRGEIAFLKKLSAEGDTDAMKELFKYELPCCVFTRGLEPPKEFLDIADEACCPVLQTTLDSTEFSTRFLRIFSDIFASRKSIHGVLVEVFGVGIVLSSGDTVSHHCCQERFDGTEDCNRECRREQILDSLQLQFREDRLRHRKTVGQFRELGPDGGEADTGEAVQADGSRGSDHQGHERSRDLLELAVPQNDEKQAAQTHSKFRKVD